MLNVCQIIFIITLDTLDIIIYTLDTHGTSIEHKAYGGNHDKCIHEEDDG